MDLRILIASKSTVDADEKETGISTRHYFANVTYKSDTVAL